MKLDMNWAEHRVALEEACKVSPEERAGACMVPCGAFSQACRTLATPSLAAEALRDLFHSLGSSVDIEHFRDVQWRIVYYLGGVRMWRAVNFANGELVAGTVELVRYLLAIELDAPDRREQALAALREAGR